MLRIKKKDWIEIAIHLAFWTGVFYTLSSLTSSSFQLRVQHEGGTMAMNGIERASPYAYLTIVFLMLLFYGNIFWIFKKALRYEKIVNRVAISLGWFALVLAANYVFAGSLFKGHSPGFPPVAYPDPISLPDEPFMKVNSSVLVMGRGLRVQLTMLLIFLSVLGLSVAYFFLKEWARNELIRNRLEANQYSTEIKFLKSQINPHFLFNTLNNLFSMAQKKGNDDLADGISTLSGMMRYMIYESNAEIVPLKKEIEYLENCILLNKLRFADDEARVIFNYPEQTDGISIAPMLFIPFVENAFKHGVAIGQSSEIDISLAAAGKQVVFTCQNTTYPIRQMEAEKSGIGLENVRRRLQLVYPGKHELTIKDKDAQFSVELKINLE
jgi:two-component system, LytTR family, sensor kinase